MVECAVEDRKGGLRLVVWDLMARFVDTSEGEVAVLAHFAVFHAIVHEGLVAGSGELGRVGVVQGERDGLSAEPIADVVFDMSACGSMSGCFSNRRTSVAVE